MACKHKSRVWENGWCNVACRYCTYTQESTCEHNKQTNADKFRNMTDEQLAAWLINAIDGGLQIPFCQWKPECEELVGTETGIPDENCKACMMAWLKREAEQ